jgi:spore germination cell wall hydrolase CwlJ-like protein
MLSRPGPNRFSRTIAFGQWLVVAVSLAGVLFQPSPASATGGFVEEVNCLALNIYFEARDQPTEGKLAVGHVVMNRVASPRFPKSVCKVVRQGGEIRRNRCQFSWWCDGRSDEPRNEFAWNESIYIAKKIFIGFTADPTNGALWYHADYVRPPWHKSLKQVRKIGQHIFYQNGKSAKRSKPPS